MTGDRDHALIAGVDGGATRTRVRVSDPSGQVVGEAEGGPGSLTPGAEKAARNIRAALLEALAAAGGRLGTCRIVCGLAGHRQEARRALFERLLAGSAGVEVISDGYAALLGAHRGEPGAVVIVGTGSVGLRLDDDGRCHQVGGWGPVVGDEGGGSWLGREAVRVCLRATDEGSDSPFIGEVRDVVGGGHGAILDWVADAEPADFARLVPIVIDHEDRGDPAASHLVERAARETERLVRLASERGRVPVALMGGLADTLLPRLDGTVRAWLVQPAGDAVDGALLRAAGMAPPEIYG